MPHAILVSFYPGLIPRHDLIAGTLREQGWKVSAIVWRRGPAARTKPESVPGPDHRTEIHLPAGGGSLGLLWKMPGLYLRVRRAVSRLGPADMVVLTHFCLLPLAWLLPAGAGSRVYDAADFFSWDFSRYFGRAARIALPVIQFVERCLLRAVDGVLCADSRDAWLERHYRDLGMAVHVCRNYPSLADEAQPGEIARVAGRYAGRRVVAYVGGLKREKGVMTVLRAAGRVRQRLPDVLFVFIGNWQGTRDHVMALVAEFGLQGHVRFEDEVGYAEMQAHLKSASVGIALLQGPRNERAGPGGSRKIFSYMQAGLPIVASHTGVVCSVVEKTACGLLVNAESLDQVVDALLSYLEHPERARRDGEVGRQAFLSTYHWQREQPALLDFIASLRAGNFHPPGRQGEVAGVRGISSQRTGGAGS